MGWLILATSLCANATASVLIKLGMGALPAGPLLRAALLNPWLWAGALLYGVALVTYALALQRFPLNVAHPILTAGAIGLVALSSVIVFHESLPASAIVGLLLLVIGVTLLATRPF